MKIELQAADRADIDIQLEDNRGHKIICWDTCKDGLASDKRQEKAVSIDDGIKTQTITYSGYNGVDGDPGASVVLMSFRFFRIIIYARLAGHETVSFQGITQVEYSLHVYGYTSGKAKVTYKFVSKNPNAPPADTSKMTNRITKVDLMIRSNKADVARNVQQYRAVTAGFERLLIRRGSYADVGVSLSKQMEAAESFEATLSLVGDNLKPHKQVLSYLPDCSGANDLNSWYFCTASTEDDPDMHMKILRLHVPVTAPFAIWRLTLVLKNSKGEDDSHTVDGHDIVTLFNPYHKDDPVYMGDPVQRSEYVENESGAIWVGTKMKNGPKPWAYNHYNMKALLATYDILTRPNENGYIMPVENLADPVRVARALSHVVAGFMLQGRWSEPYCSTQAPADCDNTKPWAWTGSMKIVEGYLTTGKPQKYGQCFVFSGLLTTLGRSIGIPTRSVTNFESAHDRKPFDANVTKYWTYSKDKTWSSDSNLNKDSVWNFHVWNDMWMKRPDLTDFTSCKVQNVTSFDGMPLHCLTALSHVSS